MRRNRFRQLALLATVASGAFQGILSYHTLVDCLPFRETCQPLVDRFAAIGLGALGASTGLALLVALVVREPLLPAAPVLATLLGAALSPALFLVFSAPELAAHPEWLGGDFGLHAAFTEFVRFLPRDATTSLLLGTLLSIVLWALSRRSQGAA